MVKRNYEFITIFLLGSTFYSRENRKHTLVATLNPYILKKIGEQCFKFKEKSYFCTLKVVSYHS